MNKLKQELTDAYIALTNENNKLTLDEFIKGFEEYLNDIDNNTIDLETYDIDNSKRTHTSTGNTTTI